MNTSRKALPFVLLAVVALWTFGHHGPTTPRIAFAQGNPTNSDCAFTFTFTGDSNQTAVSNLSGNSPCVNWRLTLSVTGTLSSTVTFQTSPDRVTWTSISNTICSATVQPPCILTGANPIVGNMGQMYVSAYGTYVRVTTSSSTGTGTGTVRAYGARGASAQALPAVNTSGFVPYTGATANVDLGAHNLTVDSPTFFVDSVNHRVGIGTITPTTTLQVRDTSGTGTTLVTITPGAAQTAASTTFSNSGSAIVTGNLTVDSPTFFVDSVNHRVGMGTTTPTSPLSVDGTGADVSILSIGKDVTHQSYGDLRVGSANDSLMLHGNANSSNVEINAANSATGNIFMVAKAGAGVNITTGNLDIGTTGSTYSLDVSRGVGLTGTARFFDQTATTGTTLVTITPGAAQTAASTLLAVGGVASFASINNTTSSFLFNGHTCTIVATVVTCP